MCLRAEHLRRRHRLPLCVRASCDHGACCPRDRAPLCTGVHGPPSPCVRLKATGWVAAPAPPAERARKISQGLRVVTRFIRNLARVTKFASRTSECHGGSHSGWLRLDAFDKGQGAGRQADAQLSPSSRTKGIPPSRTRAAASEAGIREASTVRDSQPRSSPSPRLTSVPQAPDGAPDICSCSVTATLVAGLSAGIRGGRVQSCATQCSWALSPTPSEACGPAQGPWRAGRLAVSCLVTANDRGGVHLR